TGRRGRSISFSTSSATSLRRRGTGTGGMMRGMKPRILHVSHSLRGGVERWLEVFVAASPQVDNFVLKSIGEQGSFGSQLWLHAGADLEQPLRTWTLAPAIAASAVSHPGYRQVLAEVLTELGIDGVVVSSLIGHSLDVLRSPVPTVVVLHDYYPFCSALHIFFDGVCVECGEAASRSACAGIRSTTSSRAATWASGSFCAKPTWRPWA